MFMDSLGPQVSHTDMVKCLSIQDYNVVLLKCLQNSICTQEIGKNLGLTLNALMNSSFWFDTINLRWSIVYVKGSWAIILKYTDRL